MISDLDELMILLRDELHPRFSVFTKSDTEVTKSFARSIATSVEQSSTIIISKHG